MALARQFTIPGPPMVLFFDAKGQPLNLRSTGDVDAQQFQKILQQALDTSNNLGS
jgi:thiol:disulfide interchange protein